MNDRPPWAAVARQRMGELGMTQEQLMPILNVSTRGAVGHYLSGRRVPSPEQMAALAKHLGLSLEAFLDGEAVPARKQSKDFVTVRAPVDPNGATAEVEVKFLPRRRASAGPGAENSDPAEQALGLRFRAESLRRKGIDHRHATVIYADGDSMEPLIGDGDTILFDTSRTAVTDGGIYVIEIDHEAMVKRLQRRPGGRLLVQSENPAYPPYEIEAGQHGFRVLGQVMWTAGWV